MKIVPNLSRVMRAFQFQLERNSNYRKTNSINVELKFKSFCAFSIRVKLLRIVFNQVYFPDKELMRYFWFKKRNPT